MLRPKALDHVGLIVSDMDRSVKFYQRLGLELLRRSEQGAEGASSAVLKVGDQEINLFCRPDFVSDHRDDPRGIDHFCLMMENVTIDDLVEALFQAGIHIVSGPVKRRAGAALFVTDPDGARVELQINIP